MIDVLKEAWRIYVRYFSSITTVALTVLVPVEILQSYLGNQVLQSPKPAVTLGIIFASETFIGVVATGAIIAISAAALQQKPISIGQAFKIAIAKWPAFIATRIIGTAFIALCFVMFILPGIYVAVSMSVSDAIVISERLWGSNAIARSFALTSGRFWKAFFLGTALLISLSVVNIVLTNTFGAILGEDNWISYVISGSLSDVVWPLLPISFYCFYAKCVGATSQFDTTE